MKRKKKVEMRPGTVARQMGEPWMRKMRLIPMNDFSYGIMMKDGWLFLVFSADYFYLFVYFYLFTCGWCYLFNNWLLIFEYL